MPYIYRYIDLIKHEVCYIGKVTGFKDIYVNPLENRHKQHMREEWYKKIGNENLLLQYIEFDNHTDVDILETWLINYYCHTGQLVNKAKVNWGKSNIDLYPVISGRWRNWGQNRKINRELIMESLIPLVDDLLKQTEGLEYHLDDALDRFCSSVNEIAGDLRKTYKLSRFNTQDDFMREKRESEVIQNNDD